MRVILTVGGLSPEYGGPSRSVPALAEALGRAGVSTEILTCEPLAGHAPPLLPDRSLVETSLLPSRARRWQWLAKRNEFSLAIAARRQSAGSTIIHDNGLWLPTNHAVAFAAGRCSLPLVISLRGMLTDWSRRHGSMRKRIAWRLFQYRDLNRAALLHCTSAQEARELDSLHLKPPIAIVPNGVDVPDEATLSRFRDQKGSLRTALFLSRIHPKKGLPNLIQAWAKVRPAGWRLVLAGTDELGHALELRRLIDEHGLDPDVVLPGPVDGDAKWQLYAGADLFILPSHSENFGIVVAEALACGLPVITTKGTPWQELEKHSSGWWVEIGVEPLVAALRDAFSRTDEERYEMGRRGRQLVEQRYSWPGIAAQMQAVYLWMLGQEGKPDCVVH